MTYQPIRPPRHEHIDIRGLKHRLTWWGEPTDTPVVLLHGLQDCGDTWQFVVDCLPDDWTLVAPDWRGFGGSDWAPGGYWFPDYLADLEALLDTIAPESPARVIAHSMGANITGLYAGIRPRRLKWFVNMEGVGLRRTEPTEAPGRYARWLDELKEPLNESRYTSVQQLADRLMKRNPRLTADRASFVARAWTRNTDPLPQSGAARDSLSQDIPAQATPHRTAQHSAAQDLPTHDSTATRSEAHAVRLASDPRHRLVNPVLYKLEEAEACWSHIEIPMLLLAGANSSYFERRPQDFSDDHVHKFFTDAKIAILPGVGHMMHHEDPQAVATQIIDFARTHP
jgi:pimeloyl-ACP methyl ester carboxylesterase